MSAAPRVWVTRAEPGASATAARLQAMGFAPLVAPLLTLQPVEAAIDLAGVTALAFTSTNGVSAYVTREAGRDLPVFTVGEATAKAARKAGFTRVQSARGDVGDLGRLIAAQAPGGRILHPGGRDRAGDLAGHLRRHGVEAETVAIYEALAAPALPPAAAEVLAAREVAAVLIHSPRAAAVLADLAPPFDLSEMIALGLSFACLRPVSRLPFADFAQARRPSEDALLDALLVALGNRAGRR